jgi:nickel-dependent lactate racemase
MPSREDWIIGGIIVAVLAALGITIYVLHRRKVSGQQVYLKKVKDRRTVMSNYERVQMIRDRKGNLSELVIRREIHE